MATDSRKKPGRGFASTARASAITRFMKKNLSVRTLTSADGYGLDGVRVSQEPYAAEVVVRVHLALDETAAAEWANEIEAAFTKAGYLVRRYDFSKTALYVSKAEWVFADMVATKMFGIESDVMESAAGLARALPSVIAQLRGNGWIEADTLELTETGEQVQAYLLDRKRARDAATRRQRETHGY